MLTKQEKTALAMAENIEVTSYVRQHGLGKWAYEMVRGVGMPSCIIVQVMVSQFVHYFLVLCSSTPPHHKAIPFSILVRWGSAGDRGGRIFLEYFVDWCDK